MQEKKLTGYPSIDKPWLKYYKEGAEERANNIPKACAHEKLYHHLGIIFRERRLKSAIE